MSVSSQNLAWLKLTGRSVIQANWKWNDVSWKIKPQLHTKVMWSCVLFSFPWSLYTDIDVNVFTFVHSVVSLIATPICSLNHKDRYSIAHCTLCSAWKAINCSIFSPTRIPWWPAFTLPLIGSDSDSFSKSKYLPNLLQTTDKLANQKQRAVGLQGMHAGEKYEVPAAI